MRIYVAPGHGLKTTGVLDPGAVSGHEIEHNLNRSVVTVYAAALRRCKFAVVEEIEPDPDVYTSVPRANAAGVDCGDEVHHDAGGGHGTAVLYHPNTSAANHNCAIRMAQLVSSAIGLPNRGAIPRTDLYWLNGTNFPALLPEIAFVDADQATIDKPGYFSKVGEALAKARCEYAGVPYVPPSSPGTQAGWSWCSKCKGLFYGPHASVSVCPAGGQHVIGGSFNYVLSHL